MLVKNFILYFFNNYTLRTNYNYTSTVTIFAVRNWRLDNILQYFQFKIQYKKKKLVTHRRRPALMLLFRLFLSVFFNTIIWYVRNARRAVFCFFEFLTVGFWCAGRLVLLAFLFLGFFRSGMVVAARVFHFMLEVL